MENKKWDRSLGTSKREQGIITRKQSKLSTVQFRPDRKGSMIDLNLMAPIIALTMMRRRHENP
jgi:hypothetical protein